MPGVHRRHKRHAALQDWAETADTRIERTSDHAAVRLEVSVSIRLRDALDDPVLLAAFAAGLRGAASSCEAMSGGRIHVSSSEIRRLTAADVLISAGGPEVVVAATYVGFSGRLNGHAVLMLPATEARSLARIILGGLVDMTPPGSADSAMAGMSALERSALEEIGNVAISAVLSGLGDHFGETILPTVPAFAFDMAGAVLDAIVSEVADEDGTLLAARTRFSQDDRAAMGVLLIVPAARP